MTSRPTLSGWTSKKGDFSHVYDTSLDGQPEPDRLLSGREGAGMTRTNEGSVLTGHYPPQRIDSEVVLSGEVVLEREGGEVIHLKQGEILVLRGEHMNQAIERNATFGDRVADVVAGFGGSWVFIIFFAIALAIYITVDAMLGNRAWDPYPYILLNLFLNILAALQAPIIMMSQNRQDTKDRLRSERDYDVNRRSAAEIRRLARQLDFLAGKVGHMEEMVRARGE